MKAGVRHRIHGRNRDCKARRDRIVRLESVRGWFACIERKDEELCAVPTENGGDASGFSIEDCRDILSTFLKLAKPKIISGRDDDFWIALSIKYSASEEVWRFLVDQVPPESIDRTNDINFYRSLSQRFPDIEWFSEVYHLSLGSHPDSKITQQAMIDAGEFARIVRQIYPEDDGRPKHKNERKGYGKKLPNVLPLTRKRTDIESFSSG